MDREPRATSPRGGPAEPELWSPSAPLTVFPGVGPAGARRLAAAGLRTVADVLGLLPRRYREVRVLDAPEADALGEFVRLSGRVVAVRRRWLPGRRSLVAVELACPDPVILSFFNQPYLAHGIRCGEVRASEGVLDRKGRRWALTQPRLLPRDRHAEGAVQLVYPAVEGVSDDRLRRLIAMALDRVDFAAMAYGALPAGLEEVLRRLGIASDPLAALRAIHRPEDVAAHEGARRHFAVREAVELFRRVQAARDGREARTGPAVVVDEGLDRRIAARIPFSWTGDQAVAIEALRAQLARGAPMGVLLQGDVGTGKTAVAVYVALAAVARGFQVAFLAPTELLAEQHYASVAPWLAGTDVRAELLTASLPARVRGAIERGVADGGVHLTFGTHALMSARTGFANLGLCVIDEQQRFGVDQRMSLMAKGVDPHVLVMTATPIPRTLALTLFGDLDVVALRERPRGRAPARAIFCPPQRWRRVVAAIGRRAARGEGVFVVCPKIGEDGEKGGAVHLAAELSRRFRTGLVHGRMGQAERQAATAAFRDGELDVLVGTTVLEVGVDVPRATLMVVVGCERFGLSTLHQLRGRVGRGGRRGLCILTGDATARTAALCRTDDGFELAEEDLALRGGGELLGQRQSGAGELRALDVVADHDLLQAVRDAVRGDGGAAS